MTSYLHPSEGWRHSIYISRTWPMITHNLSLISSMWSECLVSNDLILHQRHSLYRANGFAVFRSCSRQGERKLVVQFNTGVYGSKTLFSLPFCRYCSNLQTVSKKKLCFGLKRSAGMIMFCSDLLQIQAGRERAPLPYTSMRFVLPTSGLDLPCAVPNFTGIVVVIAQPASSV